MAEQEVIAWAHAGIVCEPDGGSTGGTNFPCGKIPSMVLKGKKMVIVPTLSMSDRNKVATSVLSGA